MSQLRRGGALCVLEEGHDAQIVSVVAAGGKRRARARASRRKQYADIQFTPPQGDYKLLVLRPDVTVGSLTTGGMVEPRADWTDQARASIVAALRAQQAARGGKVTIIEHRNQLPGVTEQELADVERLNFAVDQSIVVHKYLGDYLPTKRGKGLDWTLGADAVRLGQKTGYDYALFLHAEDQVASGGRIALGVLGLAGCIVGFCAPNIGGAAAARLCLAGRPQDRRGGLVQRRLGRQARCRASSSATSARLRARRRWSTGCSAG